MDLEKTMMLYIDLHNATFCHISVEIRILIICQNAKEVIQQIFVGHHVSY